MITYQWNNILNKEVPKLHRVIIPGERAVEISNQVRDWCNINCKGKYYFGPGWMQFSVEFEDDEDAVLFSLRFT
jgi:hypothetical protein